MSKKIICLFSFVLVLGLAGNASAWRDRTIGTLMVGSASESSPGTWTVIGDGDDIWNNTDNFHYVYKYLTGDGSITARVASLAPGSSEWGKAGVMMRETLTGPSTFIDNVKTVASTGGTAAGGGGSSFQWRLATSGGCGNADYASGVPPLWFRVVRSGDSFTGYSSTDGTNWTQQGSAQTVAMRYEGVAACYIGLCVTSHASGELRTAVFDNISYTGDVAEFSPSELKAYGPTPGDGGELDVTEVSLGWNPGPYAAQHDVYFGENLLDVINANTSTAGIYKGRQSELYYPRDPFETIPLTQGKTYYWRIDEVNDLNPAKLWRGDVWSFSVKPMVAYRPTPPDGGRFVPLGVTLHWRAGLGAKKFHVVYFATNFADVNNAPLFSTAYPWKANISAPRNDPNWATTTLTQTLNKTYYWRVDEIEKTTTPKIGYKGNVWSFTTTITGLGTIRREVWTGLSTTVVTIADLTGSANYPNNPTTVNFPTSFECPVDWADGYGTRMQAWLYVGLSGNYTFWIASDDNSELWLSPNQYPYDAQLIARVPNWTGSQQWYVDAAQKSAPQYLVGGNRYYIMALQKEGGGGDNLAVAWQGTDQPYPPVAGQGTAIIPGSQLMPFVQYWAYNPDPADGTDGTPLSGTLGWSAGWYAVSHDVYIGTNYSDVNAATTSSHPNVQYFNRTVNNCPIGSLNSATVYYWRVDEVNNVPPNNGLWKGQIWVFRTLGGGGGLLGMYYHWTGAAPPTNPFATFALSRIDPTVNFDWGDGTAGTPGSPAPGIVNLDLFACKWLGSVNAPVAGKYTFYTATDDGQRLFIDGQLVIDHWVDQGTTEYSSPQLTLTAGWHDIEMWMYENGGGTAAQLRWQGPIMTKQIIPAWYLSPPLKASVPVPYDGDPEAPSTVILSWRRGDKAAKHDVYFSTDFNDVNEATTLSPPSIYRGRRDPNTYDPPETFEMNQTYYWRVDEVNGTTVWPGDVWSFTVANYLVVEDYERYNNTSDIIWQTWIAGGGGKAGYNDPNCAELTIIHGGRQSMPFDYSNLNPPNLSEASRTFTTSQDWTAYGVKALSLWLRGWPVLVGSFVESPAGTYTMRARGADIFNVADLRRPSRFHDEFHYAYWQVSGDYAITAKVESITNTNGWAKAGVMVRDSLDANSVHAMACLTPDPCNGVAFQHRAAAGGISIADFNIPNINPPYWVSMTRRGTNLAAGYAPDGASWSGLYNTTVTMTDPVYIGLSLTSHNTAATCTAVFSDVHLYTVDPVGNVTEVLPLPSWTHQDIGIKSNVAAPLYVTLQDSSNNTATITHDDPNIVLTTAWQAWDIALKDFAGVSKNAIKKITIGVGTHSVATGTIYVDDIRLYPPRCFPDLVKPLADFSDDCLVGYADLAILTDNWLVKPPSGVSSGLKGYWPFNGNLQDVSGNGRNGSDPCGVITYAAGHAGQAASLNGGYVSVGSVGISGAAARTVAGWAKASTMSMLTTDWISVFGFTCSGATLTNRSFDINKWGAGNDYAIHVYGWERAILPVDLEWHHLAASYDGTTIRWYGDGQLVGEDSSRVLDTNDLVQMGRRADQTANFQGMIDEVRIYNRALSWAEIEYLAGKPMIDINNDGAVDFRDYTIMADMWLEELLWPQ